MNGTNIVFDSCAIIKLLDRKYDLSALGVDIDKTQPFTSVITRMELLAKRDIQPDEERDIRGFLDDLVVIPLNDDVEQLAVSIRRASSMKLPDCIIAATAIILDAVLLTDDEHLLNLVWPGLRALDIC